MALSRALYRRAANQLQVLAGPFGVDKLDVSPSLIASVLVLAMFHDPARYPKVDPPA